MPKRMLTVLVCLLLAATALADEPAKPKEQAQPEKPHKLTADQLKQVRTLSAGEAQFSADLFARLARQETGNLFVSPFSVHVAMSMVQAGARDKTAKEMQAVLHLPDQADRSSVFLDMLRSMQVNQKAEPEWIRVDDKGNRVGPGGIVETSPDGKTVTVKSGQLVRNPNKDKILPYELWVANALWSHEGFPVREDYRKTLTDKFLAEARTLDFADKAKTAGAINSWVDENTNGKVPKVVDASMISPDLRLVLANAVYFKSKWLDEFSPDATREEPFHLADGKKVLAELMHQKEYFGYHETDDLQVLRMPYKGSKLSMYVFLPAKGKKLSDLAGGLTGKQLTGWMDAAAKMTWEVIVTLPKWKTESSVSLGETLQAMGMKRAFSAEMAEFGGISPRPLFVSAVLHKTFVEVDEEGTEAAAVTVAMMAMSAMPAPKPEPKVFRADRPFLYAIRHEKTGQVLFIGKLTDPTKN